MVGWIFQILVLVALQGIAFADDPLAAFYPDVTNCYKGVARDTEKEAIERNQDGQKTCKARYGDENSVCFKNCIMQDEYMMFRLEYPETPIPKNLNKEEEEEFFLKMEEQRIGKNYTVKPETTAFQLCYFMGIKISAITESYNSQFQRLIEELGKCQSLSFIVPKEEDVDCTIMAKEHTEKLEILAKCIENALKCE